MRRKTKDSKEKYQKQNKSLQQLINGSQDLRINSVISFFSLKSKQKRI